MNAFDAHELKQLYSELVAAAKCLDWRPSQPYIHHNNRPRDPEICWEAKKESSLRIRAANGVVFHVQIRHERLGTKNVGRIFIFGRVAKSFISAVPNTQRCSFNSDNWNEDGYFTKPMFSGRNKEENQARASKVFPSRGFPSWDGQYIQFGDGPADILVKRFLVSVAYMENIKGGPSTCLIPSEYTDETEQFDPQDLKNLIFIQEGRNYKATALRRKRCKRLLDMARECFRKRNPGKRLQCHFCRWEPPIPTKTEIIQIHHVNPLQNYPKNGKSLSLAEAIANLLPLCPNCHRMFESHPNGGHYTIQDFEMAIGEIA